VDRCDTERFRDLPRFIDRVIDPTLPSSFLVDEDELCVVQTDPDHDRVSRRAAARDELHGEVDPLDGPDVLERPRPFLGVHECLSSPVRVDQGYVTLFR
jgi:hypothetical protein